MGRKCSWKGRNILLHSINAVEDNQDDIDLTLRAFKRNNKVEVVHDGAEALDFFCLARASMRTVISAICRR